MDLEQLAEFLLNPNVPRPWLYAALFLGTVLESFFPPWPSDLVTLYCAFQAGRGRLDPAVVFILASLGSQTGVMGGYWVGRRWGRALLVERPTRLLPTERLARLEGWFARYGAAAVLVSRFFPGVRALVTPAAGLAGLGAWRVGGFAAIAVLVWNGFVFGIGMAAGARFDWARQILATYNSAALALLLAGLAAWAIVALIRRRRAR